MKTKELINTFCPLILLLSLITIGGCSREELSGGTVAGGEQMQLDVRLTALASDTEEAVNVVRIIALDAKGFVVSNERYDTPQAEYPVKLYTGLSYTLMAVCNEPGAIRTGLDNIKTDNDLKAIRLEHAAVPQPPFVFFGEMKGIDVYKDSNGDGRVNYTSSGNIPVANATTVPIGIKRLATKISLSFIRDISTGEIPFTISNLKYTVYQIPKNSALSVAQAYDYTEGWLEQELTASNNSTTLADNNTATWNSVKQEYDFGDLSKVVSFPSFYLPEHKLANPGDDAICTYILVTASCLLENGATVKSHWRINPGNDIKELVRNTHYHIVGKIQGLGGIGIYADIRGVEENDITIDWRPLEGLVIVGDRVEDYNHNTNVWNIRTTYSGILKVVKNKSFHDVVFKYGSLFAVEAKSGDTFSDDDIVWKPATHTTTVAGWNDIPFQSTDDVPENTADNVAAGVGDPCKLVSFSDDKITAGNVNNDQWRMATTEELQRLITAKDDVKQGYTDNPGGFQTYSSLLIPNTTGRNASGTNTAGDGGTGSYWSSEGGNVFTFTGQNNADAQIASASSRQEAYTVRCVRKPENVIVSTINPIKVSASEYTGSTVRVNVESNIPYWEIECLDSGYESSVNFVDGIYSGKNTGSISVKFERWVTPQGRSFHFRITGYGYDGRTVTQDFVISQLRFYWSFNQPKYQQLTPQPPKDTNSNNYILSADETEYEVEIQVFPNADDIPLPTDAQVKVQFIANGAVVKETPFQPLNGSRTTSAKITIPANDSGSMRGVYMNIVGTGTEGGDGKFNPNAAMAYYLQDYQR